MHMYVHIYIMHVHINDLCTTIPLCFPLLILDPFHGVAISFSLS